MMERRLPAKQKMAKDPSGLTKSRPKGVVNYFPFENLDEAALREIQKFQVRPFGRIQESCNHIPYNSGKKDFSEKTGRESLEGEGRDPVPEPEHGG